MSEIHQQIQQIEAEIENAKDLVARRQLALKLADNHEFRKLFHEDYFVKEAARLVQVAGDPRMSLEQRADALEMAKATGHTKRYLQMMIQMGAKAESDLPEFEAALIELRQAAEHGEEA